MITVLALWLLGLLVTPIGLARVHGDAAQKPLHGVIHEFPVQRNLVAITFDDGPDPVYTPQVLEILGRHDARATFFVTGTRAAAFPDVTSRMAAQGHQVGSHGFRHQDYRRLTSQQFLEEIEKTEQVIQRLTGRTPTVFRPPYGEYNPYMVDLLESRGYHFVMWTWATNSNDATRHPKSEEIAQRIIGGVKPGSIILLHDHGGDRRATVQAVDKVLAHLKQKGYQFVTLDTLLSSHRPQ